MIQLSCDLYPESPNNGVCLHFEKHYYDNKLVSVSLTSDCLETPLVFSLSIKEVQSVTKFFELCNT